MIAKALNMGKLKESNIMQPLVSIVIPTFRRPIDLKRAIESVLKQTYQNIEIIVVDDNDPNTDARTETELVMSEYDGRAIYLKHDKNRNGSAARNTGWRAANGKYITFLDDDDEVSTLKIQKQVECMEKADESWGACYTAYHILKPSGKRYVSCEKRSGYLYIEALMRTLFMGSGSNLLLRKSVVDEIGGYDESFIRNQDVEFLARVAEQYKIAYIDEDLLTIHQTSRQFSGTFQDIEYYAAYYTAVFSNKINALSKKDRRRVLTVISLERSKVAFMLHEYGAAYKILRENHVSLLNQCKYFLYLMKRLIMRKSYGFYI